MGGKGGGGDNDRMRFAQAATGGGMQARQQQQPRQQQQQSRSMPPMRNTSARQQPQRGDTRIGADQLTNLYAPQQKPNPQAPMPARVGVRQERRPYNPELAIPQKDIDQLYGYGPTYAIPEKDIQKLYGGGGGGDSLLSIGEDDYDPITGEVF